MDFGASRFGKISDDEGYLGRRVDIIGRDIPSRDGEEAAEAIRRYLATDKAKSARLLAQRPVVLLYPNSEVGRVIWNPLL